MGNNHSKSEPVKLKCEVDPKPTQYCSECKDIYHCALEIPDDLIPINATQNNASLESGQFLAALGCIIGKCLYKYVFRLQNNTIRLLLHNFSLIGLYVGM